MDRDVASGVEALDEVVVAGRVSVADMIEGSGEDSPSYSGSSSARVNPAASKTPLPMECGAGRPTIIVPFVL